MLGTKLRNRYYIFKELGVGGFGQTFLAQDCDFPGQPLCVVKQLKPQAKESWMLQTARRLFDLEASVLARIGNHSQIPQLKAHFEEDEQFYLVQEYIEGNLLSEELKPDRFWTQDSAIAFLQDILQVLQFIHENQVIHRDLKPENIIRRQSDQKLVLIDFGSVKKITTLHDEDDENSEFTVVIGTPAYMPVEQQGGKPTYNSDIYALGKIVIQGLTGLSPKRLADDPHTGELVWRHLVNIDDFLAEVLTRMVKWNARDRYQNVAEIINDLSPYFNRQFSSKKQDHVCYDSEDASDTISKIVHEFKKHPEITRIKKLLFCAYKQHWENSSRVLIKYRTKFLLQELYQREPSFEGFQKSINDVVSTLNKKKKYQVVANFIIDQVKSLYQVSRDSANKEYKATAIPQVTAIKGVDPRENHSSQTETKLRQTTQSDSLALAKPLPEEALNSQDHSTHPTSDGNGQENFDQATYTSNENNQEQGCDIFDLRYEITRYTTPLRIKILLFSTLYYKVSFNEQDWSLMMSHHLDSLLKQLIQMFPTLPELETRLYATAKNFDEKEGLTQTVGAILQSLRPFYEDGQPKLSQ